MITELSASGPLSVFSCALAACGQATTTAALASIIALVFILYPLRSSAETFYLAAACDAQKRPPLDRPEAFLRRGESAILASEKLCEDLKLVKPFKVGVG